MAASAAAVAATAAAIVQRKKEYHGWLKERKITFYFGRNENYGKINVKNKVTKNHVWYKIAYNCTQLCSSIISLYVDSVFTCGIVLLILTHSNGKNDTNTSYIGNFEK